MNTPQGIRQSAVPLQLAAYRPVAGTGVVLFFYPITSSLMPLPLQNSKIIPRIGVIGIDL
jgi:hypothetical protein